MKQIGRIDTVRYQAAALHEHAEVKYRRQAMTSRKCDDQITMSKCDKVYQAQWAPQPAVSRRRKCSDGGLDLGGAAHRSRGHVYSQGRCCSFDRSYLSWGCGVVGFVNDRHSIDAGRDLSECFQPFSASAYS